MSYFMLQPGILVWRRFAEHVATEAEPQTHL